MAVPPVGPLAPPPPPPDRPDLFIVEAGASRERRCSECGRRSSMWRPVLRKEIYVILCPECAAKPPVGPGNGGGCPSCDALLRPADRFCGRCGVRIEYACPTCAAPVDAEDAFCGKCGTRVS